MAWKWRPWDYSYTVDAFADLLEQQAKYMRYQGHLVNSEKYARRCFAASGMLRQLYYRDVCGTHKYLMDKNPVYFKDVPNSNLSEWKRKKITPEKIYRGMWDAAQKRERKEEEALKDDCWAYIRKYIEYWWD
jgi:hypothetical protein